MSGNVNPTITVDCFCNVFNPLKPEFTIVVFIHYKPRIANRNSQLVVDKDDLKWVANDKKILLLCKQFQENFRSEIPRCGKLSHF